MKKLLVVGLLVASPAFAGKTQVTANTFTADKSEKPVVLQEGAVNIIKGANGGTITTQIGVEVTNMNNTSATRATAYLNCSVSFQRYLGRPIDGPAQDQFWVISPFISGGAEVGGTTTLRRTYQFKGNHMTGVYAKVSCFQNGSSDTVYPRIEAVSTVEDN